MFLAHVQNFVLTPPFAELHPIGVGWGVWMVVVVVVEED